jgi:hypothetical protein
MIVNKIFKLLIVVVMLISTACSNENPLQVEVFETSETSLQKKKF